MCPDSTGLIHVCPTDSAAPATRVLGSSIGILIGYSVKPNDDLTADVYPADQPFPDDGPHPPARTGPAPSRLTARGATWPLRSGQERQGHDNDTDTDTEPSHRRPHPAAPRWRSTAALQGHAEWNSELALPQWAEQFALDGDPHLRDRLGQGGPVHHRPHAVAG